MLTSLLELDYPFWDISALEDVYIKFGTLEVFLIYFTYLLTLGVKPETNWLPEDTNTLKLVSARNQIDYRVQRMPSLLIL